MIKVKAQRKSLITSALCQFYFFSSIFKSLLFHRHYTCWSCFTEIFGNIRFILVNLSLNFLCSSWLLSIHIQKQIHLIFHAPFDQKENDCPKVYFSFKVSKQKLPNGNVTNHFLPSQTSKRKFRNHEKRLCLITG